MSVRRRSLKTSERIAYEIVHDIVSRELVTGDKLPPETVMLEKYGVGRASLREALRLLEVQGLIQIRPGPGGGPVVGSINASHLASTASLYFHLGQMTYDELFDAYAATEPLLARLAAENPNRKLRESLLSPYLPEGPKAEPSDDSEFVTAGREFHTVVGDLADNRILALLLRTVGCLIVEDILSTMDPLALRDQLGPEHEQIARAIIDGAADKAEKLMREHVDQFTHHFRVHWPAGFKQIVEWR